MEITMGSSDSVWKQPGAFSLLVGILTKPRTTMPALGRNERGWWAVPALLTIVLIVFTVVAYSYADCQYVYRLELEHYRSAANQAARPPTAPTPQPITMAIRAAGRTVAQLVSWVAWGGALYLLVVLLGENETSFGAVWRVVLWASMPYALRSLIQSVTMFLMKKPIYNQALSGLVVDRTPPPLMTFNYVIPTRQQELLASILERLDIYLLWHLALVVIGVTSLTRFSRRKAGAVTLGIWLIFAVVTTLPHFFPGTFARFRYF